MKTNSTRTVETASSQKIVKQKRKTFKTHKEMQHNRVKARNKPDQRDKQDFWEIKTPDQFFLK